MDPPPRAQQSQRHSALTNPWQRQLKHAPARVQWDPERDLRLRPLPYRALQLGLSGEAVRRYADEWTVSIRDVTHSPTRSAGSSVTATWTPPPVW